MKIKFIEITRQAADLERQRLFQQAGHLWKPDVIRMLSIVAVGQIFV